MGGNNSQNQQGTATNDSASAVSNQKLNPVEVTGNNISSNSQTAAQNQMNSQVAQNLSAAGLNLGVASGATSASGLAGAQMMVNRLNYQSNQGSYGNTNATNQNSFSRKFAEVSRTCRQLKKTVQQHISKIKILKVSLHDNLQHTRSLTPEKISPTKLGLISETSEERKKLSIIDVLFFLYVVRTEVYSRTRTNVILLSTTTRDLFHVSLLEFC